MPEGSVLEVLLTFFKLGMTSFGGPVAHIGYFREEIVVQRRWVNDATYTDLVALCQFLPGPASSQVGFSLGLIRAGYWGGLAAWMGFTLPSAILMVAFAYGVSGLGGSLGAGLLHGLQLVAVAIVAQAVWGMARTLCSDLPRGVIAALSAALILSSSGSSAQIGAVVLGAAGGWWLCRAPSAAPIETLGAPVSRRAGALSLSLFFALLLGLPLIQKIDSAQSVALFDAFYRSGALVFGGGHVVLPLLHNAVVAPGWVSDNAFLAGYGAAQAIPGPLFTFAAYLGAVVATQPHGLLGAAVASVGIFLPAALVLIGTLPFWDTFRCRTGAQAAMRGVNAAVVGLLGAALYNPVFSNSVHTAADLGAALIGFVLLTVLRARPVLIVIMGALAGIVLTQRHS